MVLFRCLKTETIHKHFYLFIIPVAKSDMFLFFHYPVSNLQQDVLKPKQWRVNLTPFSFFNVPNSYTVFAHFHSHIQAWVSCPLLWQQLSPAYRWWERSFPRPLAAAPREWSQCRVQGQRCPQHEWYPRHRMHLEENRLLGTQASNRNKTTQQMNCIPFPGAGMGSSLGEKRRKQSLRVMWKIPSQALMLERKAFPSPCPEWAPFTSPAMSTTFRKAGTLLQGKASRGISEADVRTLRTLSCRHRSYARTLRACGTCRGSHSAHLAQVPCFHLGRWCRMGSSLQQLGFWSAR